MVSLFQRKEKGFSTPFEQVDANGRGETLHFGPLTEEDQSFIHESVNVILKICRLFGFDSKGFDQTRVYRHWELCSQQCETSMSFVKYKITAYYSAINTLMGDLQEAVPLPKFREGMTSEVFLKMDHPTQLSGGRLGRWMSLLRLRHVVDSRSLGSQVFESFMETILKSKGGMPRPSKKVLKAASYQTFLDLTRPRRLDDVSQSRALLCPLGVNDDNRKSIPDTLCWDSVAIVLRRVVQEVFRGEKFTTEDLLKPYVPSSNAHYNYSRSEFGAVGRFFHEEKEELVSDVKRPGIEKIQSQGKYSDLRYPKYTLEKMQENYSIFYFRLVRKAVHEPPFAMPLSLPEALKTRTITTGPSALYFVLKPLQKKMWSILSKHPCFELTGSPISADYIQKRMGSSLKSGKKFASLDYKNATNLIEGRASEIVCEELSKVLGLDPDVAFLLKRSLTGHIMIDPSSKNQPPDSVPQSNGQLMGSVTSFIVLCLINAAICRWTLELDQPSRNLSRITLRDAKLCVNGDDAVMPLTENGFKTWSRIGEFVGLCKSIGKVYFSSRFLNMNSTSFRYRELPWKYVVENGSDRPIHFIETPSINMGLMLGMTRSGMSDPNKDGTIGSRARDLVRSCPRLLFLNHGTNVCYDLVEKVLGNFIHFNKGKLQEANLPWFIPEKFGGLGLPCVGRFQPRTLDLRIARKIYERYQLPERTQADWPLWKMASAEVPRLTTSQLTKFSECVVGNGMDTRVMSRKDIIALKCLQILMETNFVSERIEVLEIRKSLDLHENFLTIMDKSIETQIMICEKMENWYSQFGVFPLKVKDLFRRITPRRHYLRGLTNEDYRKTCQIENVKYFVGNIVPLIGQLQTELRLLLGKGHVLGKQSYEHRVRRVWRKALIDGLPIPEPFGKIDQRNSETVYNYPVQYDVDTLPFYEVEGSLRSDQSCIAKDVRLEGISSPRCMKVSVNPMLTPPNDSNPSA